MAEQVKVVSTEGLKQVFKSTKAYVDKKMPTDFYSKAEADGKFQTAEQVEAAAAAAAEQAKSDILGGAVPETLDTIKEISDWINDHNDAASAINTAIAKKADKSTTLAGYGITDAKIANGVITLGEQSITFTAYTDAEIKAVADAVFDAVE